MANKAAFLDRDGVINIDKGYIKNFKDISFINGSLDAMRLLLKYDYKIFIVTNQSGIARGIIDIDEYLLLEKSITKYLEKNSILISGTYFCPHHPNGNVSEFTKSCSFRKPSPGMILKAMKEHDISPQKSFLVGDKVSDIEASKNACLGSSYLIKSKYNSDLEKEITLYKNLESCVRCHLKQND